MSTTQLLLKAQAIEQMQGERKVHFLNQEAVRINKSLGDAVGMKNLGIHLIYVEPGKETTEFHMHHCEEEAIYVISGKGRLRIDSEEFDFETGDFVGFPRATAAHTLSNDGVETLICLVVGQRLDYDVCDYPQQEKRLYRVKGKRDLVNISDIDDQVC